MAVSPCGRSPELLLMVLPERLVMPTMLLVVVILPPLIVLQFLLEAVLVMTVVTSE